MRPDSTPRAEELLRELNRVPVPDVLADSDLSRDLAVLIDDRVEVGLSTGNGRTLVVHGDVTRKGTPRLTRGLAVAAGTFAAILVTVSGLLLLRSGMDESPGVDVDVTDDSPTVSPVTPDLPAPLTPQESEDPGDVAVDRPNLLVPQEDFSPPAEEILVPPVWPLAETTGAWTEYEPWSGIPAGWPLFLTVDGRGDVWAVSGQTGDVSRFDAAADPDRTSEPWIHASAPDWVPRRYIPWVVGLPSGGVLYGFAPEFAEDGIELVSPGGAIGFDGDEWFLPTLPDGSTLELYGTSGAQVGADGSVWIVDDDRDKADDAPRVLRLSDDGWAEFAGPAGLVGAGPWNARTRIAVAPDGAMWVVTSSGAARQYGDGIEYFDFGRSQEACCSAWIIAAPNGDVWVHADTGVDRFREGSWVHFGHDQGAPPHPDGFTITGSDGSLWLSARTNRIAHFDGQSWSSYTREEAAALSIPVTEGGARILPVAAGSSGSVWVLTHEGILHHHNGSWWSEVEPPDGVDFARGDLTVAPDGSVWLTSRQQIIARFEPVG